MPRFTFLAKDCTHQKSIMHSRRPKKNVHTFFGDRHNFDTVLGNVAPLLDGNQNDFETRPQQKSLQARQLLLQKRSNLPFFKPLHAKIESKINYSIFFCVVLTFNQLLKNQLCRQKPVTAPFFRVRVNEISLNTCETGNSYLCC